MTDIFFNNLRKLLVLSLALIFTFAVVYIPQEYNHHKTVESAQAFLGVDVPNLVQNTISAVKTFALHLKEFVLDGLAWAIAKAIVSRLVANLVDWINSGFKGSPAFLSDFEGFLLGALDQAAGKFIYEELGEVGSFICSPFKLDIQIALALKYQTARESKPYEGCTLSGVIDNIEGFLDGNFKEGGWKDWINITSQPEKYTPYGQLLTAEAGLQARLVNSKGKELAHLNWGQGFLSGKVCEILGSPSDGAPVTVKNVPDLKPSTIGTIDVNAPAKTPIQSNTAAASSLSAPSSKEKCTVSKPGTTIANALNKSLGAGQDSLIAADEIDEIIGALIGQIANAAITGAAGLLGLSPGTGQTTGGYSGGSFTAGIGSESGGSPESAAKNLQMLTDALSVQEDYKALADSTIPTLQAYIANPRTPVDKKPVAQFALDQALKVQGNAPGYITAIRDLITKYNTLETEYNNPKTTAARKSEIRQLELSIITTFSGLRVYSLEELEGSYISWKVSSF